MKNRFMLAPLTNLQGHADGVLSDAEYHWLTLRARGGFGLVMTCAAHVQAIGQGFPGQVVYFPTGTSPGSRVWRRVSGATAAWRSRNCITPVSARPPDLSASGR